MTKERANEIERSVFYRNVGFLTALNLNPEKMFELGRISERIHRDLKNELSKEIEEVNEHESEIQADERRKFAEWCKIKGYSCYDWRMLIEEYEKEQKDV